MVAGNTQSQSAAVRAYRAIEQRIVTLELAPGTVWTEQALIDAIGLGRTPVREAVQRLSWEGLVEIRPRAGISITPIQPGDWIKVLEARLGIEQVLARDAARFATDAAIALMKGAATDMQMAVAGSDVLAFLAADKDFDEGLAEASDNPFAVRVAQPLQSHSRRFWYRYRGQTGLSEAAKAHIALINAIAERDSVGAANKAAGMIALLQGYARSLT